MIRIFLFAATLMGAGVAVSAQDDYEKRVAGKTAAEFNKNIQVLKDLPAIDLVPTMEFMAASLGVGCEYCHVSDNTGRWPMEKDDKPTKAIARRMIAMVQQLNAEQFKRANAVTCATCHRGAQRRTTTPPLFDPSAPPQLVPASAAEKPLPQVAAVLDRFVAAIGGRAANEAVRSRRFVGTIVPAAGAALDFEVLEAAPDKLRVTVKSPRGTGAQVVDGDAVWTLDPQFGVHGETGREAQRLRRLAAFDRNLKLGELDPSLAVLGTQVVGGRTTIVLEGTLPNRQIERLFFDAENGLLVRRLVLTPTPLGSIPEQTDYEDYRAVASIKLPFLVRRTTATFSNTQRYNSIEVNVPADPAQFRKPAL